MDTSGWSTYSSPQYPVTFQYPPDWVIWVDGIESDIEPLDGCTTINCVTIVSPPEFLSDDGTIAPSVDGVTAPVELIRNGFADDYAVQLSEEELPDAEVEVLGSVPGLTGWGLDQDGPGQVVVVSYQSEYGVDYFLSGAGSTMGNLALGDQNPVPDHTETLFSLSTNVGDLGGETDGEHAQTLIAILASVQPNPGFAPTQLEEDGTMHLFGEMSTPAVGAVSPDSSWKTYTSQDGNVTVRYPSTWTVDDEGLALGIVWIVAPSGHIIDLLTNGTGDPLKCDSGGPGVEVLGTVAEAQATSKSATGPAEIRWTNGGETSARVELTQPGSQPQGCYYRYLSFGGTEAVYLGSADNLANPTPEELDQAVAILASARRAS